MDSIKLPSPAEPDSALIVCLCDLSAGDLVAHLNMLGGAAGLPVAVCSRPDHNNAAKLALQRD